MNGIPDFCEGCWKGADCKQAEHMTADTEPVDGFVDFDTCDHFCGDCLGDDRKNTAPLGSSESLDSPAHCAECGVPLRHALTEEGVRYVREAVAEGAGCCRELWPVIWADYLETDEEDE